MEASSMTIASNSCPSKSSEVHTFARVVATSSRLSSSKRSFTVSILSIFSSTAASPPCSSSCSPSRLISSSSTAGTSSPCSMRLSISCCNFWYLLRTVESFEALIFCSSSRSLICFSNNTSSSLSLSRAISPKRVTFLSRCSFSTAVRASSALNSPTSTARLVLDANSTRLFFTR